MILAALHKMVSTFVQFNPHGWYESGLLRHDWAWMHPNFTYLSKASPIFCPGAKVSNYHNKDGFCKAWSCLSLCLFDFLLSNNGTDQCTQVKSCYSECLQTQQKAKHQLKLVFGTENIAILLVALLLK